MRGKKLLSLLLALILCLSLLPAALAEEPEGVIAPAEEEDPGLITPVDPQAPPPGCTGWAVPLSQIPPSDDLNATGHTIVVPDVKLEDLTDEIVYHAMMAMKTDFPEGMPWTNDDYYDWNGMSNYRGYGCAGFAFLLSDAAFGKLPAQMLDVDYESLRPGDILRVNNDQHSVIILEVFSDHVVVAEGNFNSSIHWGRRLSRAEVEESDYVLTRWLGTVDLERCSLSVSIEPSVLHYDQDFTIVAAVTDKDGRPVMGEVVYFAIQNESGQYVSTRPLDPSYDLIGIMTDSRGQAVFPFSFREADGRIVPGRYRVYAKLGNPREASFPSAVAPFTLLGEGVPGDVNSDGLVDIFDLVRLRKQLSGLPVEIDTANADLDGNGTVGAQDLMRLRLLLLGIES